MILVIALVAVCALMFFFLLVLIRRWGILWRPLEVRFDKRAALIGCCMRLHNYCIDHRITDEDLHTMNGEEAIPVPSDNPNSDPPGSRSR